MRINRRNRAGSLRLLDSIFPSLDQFPNILTSRLENVDFSCTTAWIEIQFLEIRINIQPEAQVEPYWQWLSVAERTYWQSVSLVLENAAYAASVLRRLIPELALPLMSLTIPQSDVCLHLLPQLSHLWRSRCTFIICGRELNFPAETCFACQ